MTGSLADAEDLLQEAFLKWRRVDEPVENPRAFLAKLVTRLCLDWLKSARARRETYVGPWLPEPVLDAGSVAIETNSELAHDISVALLLALERLSPLERTAFLLHDVFDVDYAEVAEILSRSEVACRQLAARARTHLRTERPRYRPTPSEVERVQSAFAAAASGDLAALRNVLAEDAVFYTDGGGRVAAATRPIQGRERILRFVQGILAKFPRLAELRSRVVEINGLPGIVLLHGDRVEQTLAFDVRDAELHTVYAVRNPDKLARVAAH
jgi:RNA polymerase sigma-70 factor (ECF subfamily)